MKRILLSFLSLVLCVFLLTGCSDKPFIVFNSEPITPESQYQYTFPVSKRIYYAVVMPKGFKDKVIKIQVFKKDETSDFWGYSYVTNRTVELQHDKFYRDYMVLHQTGRYAMQVFYLSNLHKPLMVADFWVR